MSIKNKTHIHWFRNDLRLVDQPFGSFLEKADSFFGVYIIDPNDYRWLSYGFRKSSLERLQFLREALQDLQQQLRKKGSDLLVKVGKPEEILPELISSKNGFLTFQKEYATEERKAQEAVISRLTNDQYHSYDGGFLIAPTELPFNDSFPKSFSGFRKKAEKLLKNKQWEKPVDEIYIPKSSEQFATIKSSKRKIHAYSDVPWKGGNSEGMKRLMYYLFETEEVKYYKEKRNGLTGTNYSSKLSLYLANGALSPATIMHYLKRFETEVIANKSTYWLFFEVLWRDFFRHAGVFYKDQLFFDKGITNKSRTLSPHKSAFEWWRLGNTKNDFIDANMKTLIFTGYMSNRGRQNVASYLLYNLKEDWKKGAAWFEHCLLDYDVYSNQGNWFYIAGLGFDPKGGRVFDIDFQAERYDQNREFRDKWI